MRFLFDFISPYSYLAWNKLKPIANRFQKSVEPVPILLAGVLNAHDTKGPAEVEAERRYVFLDVLRNAARLGIPITVPPSHPFNPLPYLREVCAAESSVAAAAVVDRVFDSIWKDGVFPDTTARFTDTVKMQLKRNTDEAIAQGVFGVPTVLLDDHQMFWGLDSFPNLESYLAGELRPDLSLAERWNQILPSASRAPDWIAFCREWLAAWTGNRPEELLRFYADTAFYRDPARPNGLRGIAEIRPYFTRLLAANPDWRWRATEVIPTQRGFTLKWHADIPMAGRKFMEAGLDIVEVKDGKIIRNEVYFDRAEMLFPVQLNPV
ncbi:MAG: DsbA family protein [Bdellovibrionota bacterium]